jgi:hypothetical protein
MTRCQIARLLATSALVVAWAASPSQWLLAAQDPASPAAAAGTAPARAASTSAPAASDLPSQVDPNLQVLTQGSLHEAFGQPVLFNPGPNPVIPSQPPAVVDELPPDTKPAGNVDCLGIIRQTIETERPCKPGAHQPARQRQFDVRYGARSDIQFDDARWTSLRSKSGERYGDKSGLRRGSGQPRSIF